MVVRVEPAPAMTGGVLDEALRLATPASSPDLVGAGEDDGPGVAALVEAGFGFGARVGFAVGRWVGLGVDRVVGFGVGVGSGVGCGVGTGVGSGVGGGVGSGVGASVGAGVGGGVGGGVGFLPWPGGVPLGFAA
ncbi:MAG: hypothetical protein Q7S35_10330 [Candidatus Limnocylindrales bacterium]|nr:hypothetical protein [Candidatus Limnocylindrales bacterium]